MTPRTGAFVGSLFGTIIGGFIGGVAGAAAMTREERDAPDAEKPIKVQAGLVLGSMLGGIVGSVIGAGSPPPATDTTSANAAVP